MIRNKKIIIVGAGIAGISAAIHLAKSGYYVDVLEQNSMPGGRMISFMDKTTGEFIDNGQHLMSGAYTNFLDIINELGTKHLLNFQDSLKVRFSDYMGDDFLDASLLPGNAGIILGLLRLKYLKWKSKYYIAKLFIKLKFNAIDFHNINVCDFLEDHQQTNESIRRFWQPLTLATLNLDINNAPAKMLINVLRNAFFSSQKKSVLIFPNHTLSSLIEPFHKWLGEHESKLILNKYINILNINEDTLLSITSGDDTFTADSFIFAIPPDNLFNMLPDDLKKKEYFSMLNSFDYSPIISIYYWLDKDFKDIDFSAMIGTESQWIFNRMKICSNTIFDTSKYKGRITITISNAEELINESPKRINDLCWQEVQDVFPDMQDTTVLHSKVIKMRKATIKLTSDMLDKLPDSNTPIKGLFLAGDYANTGLPATIESAAKSGIMAAESVIEYLK